MRSILLVIALTTAADAQEWSVDLYDIDLPGDAPVDRVRAEAVRFLPDGKAIATAGYFYRASEKKAVGEVVLRKVADKSVTATLRGTARSYAGRAGTLAVAPSGKFLAAAGRTEKGDEIIDVFELESKKLVRTHKSEHGLTSWLAFSPDSKLLAAAHIGGNVTVWEGDKLKSSLPLKGTWPLAFAPSGKFLATAREAGIKFFSPVDGGELGRVLSPDAEAPWSLAFSPDGKLLASGTTGEGTGGSPIRVWSVKVSDDGRLVTASALARLNGHRDCTYSLVFSPDGKLLATASQDKTARLWEVATMRQAASVTAHRDFVYDVAFSPDGKLLVTLGRDSMKLWKVENLLAKK